MKAAQERSTNWLTNIALTTWCTYRTTAQMIESVCRCSYSSSILDVTIPRISGSLQMHRQLQHSHACRQHSARMGASASFLRSFPHRYALRQQGNRSVQVSALPHPTSQSTPVHDSYNTIVCFNSAHRQMQGLGITHLSCRGCLLHRSPFWWVSARQSCHHDHLGQHVWWCWLDRLMQGSRCCDMNAALDLLATQTVVPLASFQCT